MRTAFALIPVLMLAGCGGDEDNLNAPVTSTTPVAQASAPAGQNWLETVAKTPEGGVVQGNPNAPIKLVEYGSRSCPVCGRFAIEGVEPLREKYVKTGQVSYEFRDFFVHPQDPGIALLGHCVATEAFFPVLDGMFAQQEAFNARATNELAAQIQGSGMPPIQQAGAWAEALGYVQFLMQSGVPEQKARQCMGDQNMIQALSKTVADGQNNGVNGTPNFFINGKKVEAISWADLEPQLRAAGAR